MAYHLVGLDLGGTKIATALTDTDSKILKYETVPTDPLAGPEVVIAAMVESIRRITSDVRPHSVLGVGVAIAGMVESDTGRVVLSPNLGWEHVPLGERLTAALEWPVYIGHDVGMAALGELHYGVARGKRDVVLIAVGTGIGAGLILNGHLYQGAHGFAGEVGQLIIDWRGGPGQVGQPACLEGLASGPAMQARVGTALAGGEASRLREVAEHPIAVETIQTAFDQGDAVAGRVIESTGELLGVGAANLINLLNPEMLVLAGGVIRGVPALVERVKATVASRALPEAAARCEIVTAQFGREAGVIGATVLAKMAGKLQG